MHSRRFLELLSDMDELLYTRSEYSFDKWLTEARSWGETKEEKDLMERDATSLVTIWGLMVIRVFLTIRGVSGQG